MPSPSKKQCSVAQKFKNPFKHKVIIRINKKGIKIILKSAKTYKLKMTENIEISNILKFKGNINGNIIILSSIDPSHDRELIQVVPRARFLYKLTFSSYKCPLPVENCPIKSDVQGM